MPREALAYSEDSEPYRPTLRAVESFGGMPDWKKRLLSLQATIAVQSNVITEERTGTKYYGKEGEQRFLSKKLQPGPVRMAREEVRAEERTGTKYYGKEGEQRFLSKKSQPGSEQQTLDEQRAKQERKRRREIINKEKRAAFTKSLMKNGAVSEKLVASGHLDKFEITDRVDALMHILVGDRTGGAHHLRTILDLGVQNVVVSNSISSKNKIKPSGSYHVGNVEIQSANGVKLRKVSGSTMFPNDWDAEKVINATIAASETQPVDFKSDKGLFEHIATVDGVEMIVITANDQGRPGQIINAYPLRFGEIS